MGLFSDGPKGESPAVRELIETARKQLKENPADGGAVLRLADALAGSGRKAEAVRLLNQHGPIEAFPDDVLKERRPDALLFKRLATLRTDAPLFASVDALRWRGPSAGFETWCERVRRPRLLQRAERVAASLGVGDA